MCTERVFHLITRNAAPLTTIHGATQMLTKLAPKKLLSAQPCRPLRFATGFAGSFGSRGGSMATVSSSARSCPSPGRTFRPVSTPRTTTRGMEKMKKRASGAWCSRRFGRPPGTSARGPRACARCPATPPRSRRSSPARISPRAPKLPSSRPRPTSRKRRRRPRRRTHRCPRPQRPLARRGWRG